MARARLIRGGKMLGGLHVSQFQRFGDTGLGSVNWKVSEKEKKKGKKATAATLKKKKKLKAARTLKTHPCPMCKRLFRNAAAVADHGRAAHPEAQSESNTIPVGAKPAGGAVPKQACRIELLAEIEPWHQQPHLKIGNEVAARMKRSQVERTSDTIQIDIQAPQEGGVFMLFLPDALEIRYRVVTWPTATTCVLGSIIWRRLPYREVTLGSTIGFVEQAEKQWETRKLVCKKCGNRVPPERTMVRTGAVYCGACALKTLAND